MTRLCLYTNLTMYEYIPEHSEWIISKHTDLILSRAYIIIIIAYTINSHARRQNVAGMIIIISYASVIFANSHEKMQYCIDPHIVCM